MSSDGDYDEFELVDSLDVAKQIAAEKQPDISKIRAWLNPTDYTAPSSEFRRHLSSKAVSTGEWIRETPQFSQWHQSADHGSLWIKGVPGAGKSVVAASMVDSLAHNESVPVLYFFFRQIIETNRASRSLLRDWLSQLLPFSEMLQVSLWEYVEEKNESEEDKKDLESVSTGRLWNYLLAGLRSVNKAYCVVDALDESSVDEDFLSQLDALGSFRPAQVKVLMTSRPKQYLQRLFKNPQVIHISLEEQLVKRDISTFVRQRAASLSRESIDIETQEFIIDTLCERSEGLFLYARLMLDQIAKSIKEKEHGEDSIREMVTQLPIGLEQMYNQVLFDSATLTNIDQNIQFLILQLVTHSARPLRLIEIANAVEMTHSVAMRDRDSKEIVRGACGPLLEIMEDEVVHVLHHTFTEFLLDRHRSGHSLPQFPVVEPTIAHRDITLACLACLRGGAFDKYEDDEEGAESPDGDSNPVDFRPIFLQYPLVEYAATKWPYHANAFGIEDESFFNSLNEFCEPRSSFRAWLKLMSGMDNSKVSYWDTTRLHIAAGFGLTSWAKHLIKGGMNLDALDHNQNTPLFWASKGGESDIVDLLLKAGAEPDIDGYHGLKPLHAAAVRNYTQVVKLLLAAGVSPTTIKTRDVGRRCGNARSTVGEHPLMYASQSGHVETVLEMIPYAEKEDLEEALCLAAKGGHFRLISALLERSNVSPDSTAHGETALMLAVKSSEPECVRILLEKGATVQGPPREWGNHGLYRNHLSRLSGPAGSTPLHIFARVWKSSMEVVAAKIIMDMLLSAGADIEARDCLGNTPLLSTIIGEQNSSGSVIALDLLLSAGADPCAMDDNGETLLHRVCKSMNSKEVVEKLLSYKALPDQARSSDGATPLHCCVENARGADHIQLLIDHGADINAQDFNGNTPLHTLYESNSWDKDFALNELLRLGADVNIRNNLGETCLHIPYSLPPFPADSASVYRKRAHLIIDAGFDLEICDRGGMTLLLSAISNNRTLVDVLLQLPKGSSISARTFLKGKTALHLACQTKNSLELVKFLVSKGADLRWTDKDGNTLLHEVAERFGGYPEEIALVEELVKMGIPTNATNCQRQTAAHIIAPIGRELYGHRASRETFVSVLVRLDPQLDVNAKDINGCTPLHLASAASERDTFNLLQAGADLNAKSFRLRTPLHCAARGRQSGIIAMLLHFGTERDQKIDVNAADVDGRTALHDACRSGRPESVSILIDAGAVVEQKGKSWINPFTACAEFIEENQAWCLKRKANNEWVSAKTTLRGPSRYKPQAPSPSQQSFESERAQDNAVRVGVIAKMLIKAGAYIGQARQAAVEHKNGELLAAIQQESPNGVYNYVETLLLFPVRNAAAVLESYKGYGPIDYCIRFIEGMDEATMDALLARGVDFTKPERSSDEDGIAIATIARLGMTELMSKIISKAKLLDDHGFSNSVAEQVHAGYSRIRPLLQVACDQALCNMNMVKLLVTEGQVDVNAEHQVTQSSLYGESLPKSLGRTALHVLASGDFWWQADAIKYLVNHGSRVDAVDENGQTPLEIASTPTNMYSRTDARNGFFKPRCCEILLQLGADPNIINHEGLTPLNRAGTDMEIIKVLLKHGADVNLGTKGVLVSAVEAGDVEMLKIYLENGADCNVPDTSTGSEFRPNDYDVTKPRYPIAVAAFPPKFVPWDTPGQWGTARAAEMLKLFLDNGAKLDFPVNDGNLILHFLFERATSSALRPFIERPNLDFNIRDQKGRTVFIAACLSFVSHESQESNLPKEKLQRLKEAYLPAYLLLADSDLYGSSIDYLAVDNNGKHFIFYLLPKWNDKIAPRFFPIPGVRALVRQKDNAGFSPLHVALRDHRISACLQLIDEGDADLLEPDPNGDTALHHLFRTDYGSSEIALRLPLVERFLSLGGDINARNNVGETALLTQLGSGYLHFEKMTQKDIFLFFIDKGADFQAVKSDGATALHLVARWQTSTSRMSWLPRRVEGESTYNATIFKRLVELGCDPLQEDAEGRTSLDVAAAMGNDEILDLCKRKKGVEIRRTSR